MTIAAILKGKAGDIASIGPDVTLKQAADLLADRHIGCVPVLQDAQVVGMLSERDIIRSVSKGGTAVLDQPVREWMTSPVVSVTSDLPVITALSLMTNKRFRHLPVVEQDQLIGFISIGDLVKHRIDHIEAEASAMRDYILNA